MEEELKGKFVILSPEAILFPDIDQAIKEARSILKTSTSKRRCLLIAVVIQTIDREEACSQD